MKKTKKTLEFKFERLIHASPGKVYDAWLNPKIPGTPWNIADTLKLNPERDGFFYLAVGEFPHYGRFAEVKRPSRIQHTWMSPNTSGLESTVTLTFKKKGENTLMTLVHSDLPNTDGGKGHEEGWNYFLNIFPEHFGKALRKRRQALNI